MATRRHASTRTQVDHDAVAAAARLAPGTWVVAGLYPSTSSAAGTVRNVEKARTVHYAPAGSFEARRQLQQDGVLVSVRFVGTVPAGSVKPSLSAKKSTAGAKPPAGRPSAAPGARLLETGGPSDPAWHAARREGLCGTDVAAILGLTPGRGPRHVYEEKHGNTDAVAVEETSRMRMGRRLEPVIAELFAEETGLAIAPATGTLVNIERPWMRGNVDVYVLDDSGQVVAPLEVKQRGAYDAKNWVDGPPDAAAVQAMWYAAVGGWSHAHVAGLLGGNELAHFRIDLDPALIGDLIEHCEAWWQRHIVEGFPPPADGLDATAKLLARLWQGDPQQTAQVDREEAARLRAEWRALTEEKKAVAKRLTEVENAMRLLSGAAEVAESDGKPAWNWKQNGTFKSAVFAKEQPELAAAYRRPAEVLDVERLAAEHPDIHRQYLARVLRVPVKGV
ncbi:YqaJ viral recombinase family nuclease [Streptomyces sp. NBC_01207]|uniref:YqaJ viral recombinase family nuclease n=1 Tax=Streptomyces sp. NBC_01207 TaxID=2903772 RepID=UPI002E166ED6|nr:YqaJ viral recombinase family protein [Streptomyces sp. NBC_01207]